MKDIPQGSQSKPVMMICRPDSCEQDEDEHILESDDCHHIHYQCTKFPLYQLQLFLATGYKRYKY